MSNFFNRIKYSYLGLFLLCGCASTITHGIPNLAQVEPGMWRGGQPSGEGWRWLKSQGVTNVVKLNEIRQNLYAEVTPDTTAICLGMTVIADEIDFPTQMFPHNQVFLPNEVQLALYFIKEHPLGTYIHCSHGQDRTGLIVACYRLTEGWTKADAEKEMISHGFHKELFGLWEYWKEQHSESFSGGGGD
jgi:tyrosine-protein phosphatase SIW14